MGNIADGLGEWKEYLQIRKARRILFSKGTTQPTFDHYPGGGEETLGSLQWKYIFVNKVVN